MRNLLVVCSGNICRSPMAEGILRSLIEGAGVSGVEVRSAGTLGIVGQPPAENAVRACREKNVDISSQISSALDSGAIAWADVVLGMEERHLDECRELAPAGGQPRLELLGRFARPESPEIDDPVGQDLAAFRECRELIFAGAREFVRREILADRPGASESAAPRC